MTNTKKYQIVLSDSSNKRSFEEVEAYDLTELSVKIRELLNANPDKRVLYFEVIGPGL